MMQSHVIWGHVEATEKSSSSDCAEGTLLRQDSQGSGHHLGPTHSIQSLLDGVSFKDSSTSSELSYSEPRVHHGLAGRPVVRCGADSAATAELRQRAADALGGVLPGSAGHIRGREPHRTAQAENEASEEVDEGEGEGESERDEDSMEDVIGTLRDDERNALMNLLRSDKQETDTGLGMFWSVGSMMHGKGKCRACHYAHTKQGCSKGVDCTFCHLPHTKKGSSKPAKSKRLHCQQFFSRMEEMRSTNPKQFLAALHAASTRSPYLQCLLERHLQQGDVAAESGAAASSSEAPSAAAPPSLAAPEPRKKHILSL